MNSLAEKLANAWIKKDLIDIKPEDFPKNRRESSPNTRKISQNFK